MLSTRATAPPQMDVAHILINTLNTTVRDGLESPTKMEVPRHGRRDHQRRPWPIQRPEVIAGRHRGDELVMVGRTVPLTAPQLAALVRPGSAEHPWPDEVSSQRWEAVTAESH